MVIQTQRGHGTVTTIVEHKGRQDLALGSRLAVSSRRSLVSGFALLLGTLDFSAHTESSLVARWLRTCWMDYK